MKALLINPTGLIEIVEFPEKDKLDWYYKMLDCSCIDIVNPYGIDEVVETYDLKGLKGKFCLICDDEGLLKEDPQMNPIASLLYGMDVHNGVLCGKVLVACNEYTDDGIDSVGMTENDVFLIRAAINSLIEFHNEKVKHGRDQV